VCFTRSKHGFRLRQRTGAACGKRFLVCRLWQVARLPGSAAHRLPPERCFATTAAHCEAKSAKSAGLV